MAKSSMSRNLLELNLGLLFISTSGIMGRYIQMAPPVTVWWRCLLGAICLAIYCKLSKVQFKINLRVEGWSFFISASLLAAHWVTYFYSLHLSNVAIAFITLYTYPVMTTFLEPLLLRTKFQKFHLFLGLLILIGVYIMMPEMDFENSHFLGIIVGLASAVCFSLRNIFSRNLALEHHGSLLILVQLIIGSVLLLPVLFLFEENDYMANWEALLFLGLITTAAGHTLFVRSFKLFTVSTASLLASIIPIYGIILAYFFLNEVPKFTTIIGGSIVLFTVVVETLRTTKTRNK